ncbi:MAG TPA: Wzz/FepE/Etk N-terminal domain-containing protein [Dyella sp.]|uniref:Wzz/FepE/Etk N-terminal domain-containing protein n=1 Tax=Dyella sp. TaxID=1869338 RepID=UPI002BF70ED2|nr:Wzz/FepE/Etk N-terminal domain-containing protein [Dyella sp.]HTV86713.1 Wzz/FepE/Etk N-terminal domain-containing protein [Dyella sp.]
MQYDEIYLIDTWRILVREWKWCVTALLLVLAVTFAFLHTISPQWEATAWIQIGQVDTAPPGQDPKAEPLQRVLTRLQLEAFQRGVLQRAGLVPRTREAALYRKSMKLEPQPYAGPLIKLTLRAYAPQQAAQLADATASELQAIHQAIEAEPLARAHARLDELRSELQTALADRDRLQQAVASAGKSGTDALTASLLLAGRNGEIHNLQQAQSELAERLSANYTYGTSLMWPVEVSGAPVFPNRIAVWAAGVVLGLFLAAMAAIARDALRRAAMARSALRRGVQPNPPATALTP